MREYITKSERQLNLRLATIRLDGEVEHKGDIREILQNIESITLDFSPPYASESYGIAERFNQKLYIRARVLLTEIGYEIVSHCHN